MKVKNIPLDKILDPERPVRSVASEEAMDELIASMEEYGLMEPILVNTEGELYRLVAGHRRLMAARGLEWKRIPCNVLEVDPQTAALMALEENIKREDVNPYEEALYFLHLIETHGMTQTDIANRLGYSKQQVHNRIMLLKLDPTTVEFVQRKELPMTHALELGRIGDVEVRARIRSEVMTHEMSALATRHLVDQVVTLGPEITGRGEVEIPTEAVVEELVGHYKCFFCGAPGRDMRLKTIFSCGPCLRALVDGMESVQDPEQDPSGSV